MGFIIIPKKAVSSNKNQTLQKSDHTDSKGDDPSGGGSSEPKPIIDQLSIVLTITSAELAKEVHGTLYTALTGDTEFFQSIGKPLKGFQRTKRIVLSTSGERPRIDYSYQVGLANRVRLDFNPAKLGADGLQELHGILTSVMPDGWRHFVKGGRISRLDVAVDLVGVRMTKLKMQPAISQSSQAWFSTAGKLQTYQWGKPKGTHTQIYNKTAEQATRGVTIPGPQVTRVERRLKNPGCNSLTKLAGLENPFKGIVLTVKVPDPPPGGPEYVWPLFCDSVSVRGLDLALLLLPKHKRTAYRKQFKKAAPEWWDPDAIWANWPKMLEELKIASPTAWK